MASSLSESSLALPARRALSPMIATTAAAVAADESSARSGDPLPPDRVSLRQRVWPLVEMLRRAQRADVPIVWGV